ncbi:pilus assembly PilX family protein [Desulfoluna butyratoxydans]|uniref:Type 4 fimbrial biogenesis protein PilX N-terminal domain-containing protein n=1 Tax=Desulfoluna butyratoxydans TaxID=231438 RepID=A0A4U8YI98_9BACT|nr:pilus assembly PilX N-terminal domain-containing protein [Desulfoluna butyratoxydans]VFQ42649.1 hypothetical protein MSL71_2700 [Desulfoluna butyratoxydans]
MPNSLTDERGSVMLFTLMFILIITVMGLIATQTSVFEIKIAENARRYSEELAGAEAALNHAIAHFRQLRDPGATTTVEIANLLNDTKYSDFKTTFYVNDSDVSYLDGSGSVAKIEIRRIVNKAEPVCSGSDSDAAICVLSDQANAVPRLSHRYYAGSIDKRRFAITATAYSRRPKIVNNKRVPSTTWVQKGISLPAEQDRDLF